MREMKPGRLFAAAGIPLVLLLVSLALAGTALRAVPQDKPSRPAGKDFAVLPAEEIERRIFEAVNKERAAQDLPAVRFSAALTALARKQSEDMAGRGILVHHSSAGKSYTERLTEAGILFAANGENVARSNSADPELLHGALMKSGGHRENIFHPDFDEIGIGIVKGKDGNYYLSQDFIRGVVVRDEAGARAVILAALDKARLDLGLPLLVPADDVHRTAQSFALLKSEGQPPLPVPEGYGETRVDFYAGPDLDGIAAAASERPLDFYLRVGVGVRFARTAEHPGGAYFVCVFLLVGDPALLRNDPERAATGTGLDVNFPVVLVFED